MTALDPAKVRRLQVLVGFVGDDVDGILGGETLDATLLKLGGTVVATASSFALELVRLAKKEVGVREVGTNRGARVDEYMRATWLDEEDRLGAAWCAGFICWLFKQALISAPGAPVKFARPQTAGAHDFENWANRQAGKGVCLFKPGGLGRPRGREPIRAGDVLVFNISHIGLAVGDQAAESVPTIEGNTNAAGGREGNGVWQKTRKLSEIRSVIRVG